MFVLLCAALLQASTGPLCAKPPLRPIPLLRSGTTVHGSDSTVHVADTVYASPALREFVARAAEGNREVPAELHAYRALVESEVALVLHMDEGEELTSQVEQIASHVQWRRDGSVEQRIVGHRVRAYGPNVSVLTYLGRGWLMPVLYGERLQIFAPEDSTAQGRKTGPTYEVIHPLSAQRDAVYRFDGGDTVAVLNLPERVLHVVRIRVTPRRAPDERALLFHGDIELDADRHQIVRMRGRLVEYHPDPGLATRLLGLAARGFAYFEVENAEHEARYWLPYRQRIELHAVTPLTDSRAILRIASRFGDLRLEESRMGAAPPSDPPSYRLTFATGDTLHRFDGWSRPPGEATAELSARDFDDVAPPELLPDGPPHLRFGVRRFSELMRYNRIEGAYTGAGAVLAFRDAAPGLELRGTSGWAWSEATLRGGVELSLRHEPWTLSLAAVRDLVHTNDFVSAFERHGGFPALLLLGGIDDFDYLDRRAAGIAITRDLAPGGETRVGLDVGWAEDRPEVRRLLSGPLAADTLRLNRPITPGRYARARLVLEHGRSVGRFSLRPGIGARLVLEQAVGDLEWRRIETGVQLRGVRGPLTFATRLDAGVVFGDPPPLQTLYELGGTSGLPGYEYKEFAGDRAAMLRAVLRYDPRLLDAPIRIGALVLPALAPAPVVQWQAGWTAASGAAEGAVHALGSRVTGGVASAVDVQLTFFGGILGIGFARPLERHGGWDFVWSIGSIL